VPDSLALELRAAVRLAEIDPTTRPELAAIVARCTQGLESPDLREAAQLLG